MLITPMKHLQRRQFLRDLGISAGALPFLTGLPSLTGAPAPQKPWEGAEGLEWEVPSPAPWHTFENPPKLDATATRVVG